MTRSEDVLELIETLVLWFLGSEIFLLWCLCLSGSLQNIMLKLISSVKY